MLKYFFTILIIFWSFSSAISADKEDLPYRAIGHISGYKAGVVIRPDTIKVYRAIDKLHYNNLTPAQKRFVERSMKDWKGEEYKVILFQWVDTAFLPQSRYYANDYRDAPIDWGRYDTLGTKNLPLPSKYSQVNEIVLLLKTSMLKTYAEGDLNGDKETDLVMVYYDTVESKRRVDEPWREDYHLVIFENSTQGKYVKKFDCTFPYHRLNSIGRVEIMDTNLDGVQDVILWTLSRGASGWSIIADIFSRIKNK